MSLQRNGADSAEYVSIHDVSEEVRDEAFGRSLEFRNALPFIEQLALLNSPLKRQYASTFGCRDKVLFDRVGSRETAPCNRPWCWRCRQEQWGRRFYPYIASLEQAHAEIGPLYFVTLTTVPCLREQLEDRVESIVRDRKRILKQVATSAKRRGERLVYFWKMEGAVTRKSGRVLYRPHLHVLIAGKEMARELIDRWVAYHEEVREEGQHMAKVMDRGSGYTAKDGTAAWMNGVECTLGYLGKGVVSHERLTPEQADAFYRAFHGKHVYGATRGLKQAEEQAEKSPRPRSEDIGGLERCRDELVDMVTGEMICWDAVERTLSSKNEKATACPTSRRPATSRASSRCSAASSTSSTRSRRAGRASREPACTRSSTPWTTPA